MISEERKKALDIAIPRTGTFVDPILQGVEEALLQLAEKQVQDAFNQANKELLDIRSRTSQALQKKIAENKDLPQEQRIRIGNQKGDKFITKKKVIVGFDFTSGFNGEPKEEDLDQAKLCPWKLAKIVNQEVGLRDYFNYIEI